MIIYNPILNFIYVRFGLLAAWFGLLRLLEWLDFNQFALDRAVSFARLDPKVHKVAMIFLVERIVIWNLYFFARPFDHIVGTVAKFHEFAFPKASIVHLGGVAFVFFRIFRNVSASICDLKYPYQEYK